MIIGPFFRCPKMRECPIFVILAVMLRYRILNEEKKNENAF